MSDEPGISRVGPGSAVLVVGASGVGKDTLLEGAARLLRDEPRIVFVQRHVTRNPHGSEAFLSVTRGDFDAAKRAGLYALSWEAHGLGYGIPAATDTDIKAGRTIVFNASRTAIPEARVRYPVVKVAMVTCALPVRAQRMAARGRETVAEIEARLARTVDTFAAAEADAVIDNSGSPEEGIDRLVECLRAFAHRSG